MLINELITETFYQNKKSILWQFSFKIFRWYAFWSPNSVSTVVLGNKKFENPCSRVNVFGIKLNYFKEIALFTVLISRCFLNIIENLPLHSANWIKKNVFTTKWIKRPNTPFVWLQTRREKKIERTAHQCR